MGCFYFYRCHITNNAEEVAKVSGLAYGVCEMNSLQETVFRFIDVLI